MLPSGGREEFVCACVLVLWLASMAMGVVALVALVAVQLVVTYSLLVGAGRSSTHVLQPDVAGTPESMDWHEKGGVKEEQVGSWPGSFSFFASLHTSLSLLLSLILAHGCQLFLKLDPVLLQFFREILSHEFCKSLQLRTRYYLFFIFNVIIFFLMQEESWLHQQQQQNIPPR